MRIETEWEVLVVGAGPAGALAAMTAASAGRRVLMVERKRIIGSPPHCAEYVPQALALEMDIPSPSVIQPVVSMETRVEGQMVFTRAPGLILDRVRFDTHLVEAATLAGAEVRTGTRLTGTDGRVHLLTGPEGSFRVRPIVTVAADGAGSMLRRVLAGSRPDLLTGVQLRVPLPVALDRTVVLFGRSWVHGYAWLFPRGPLANLGLGLRESHPGQAWAELHRLAAELVETGVVKPGALARTVGAIGVGGPLAELVADRVIFAGDAAGLTHPITGAGIPQAVFSGRLAGAAAARYVVTGDSDALAQYAQEVRGRYGRTLGWAGQKRQFLDKSWPGAEFASLVRQTWPAFRDYAH